MDIPPYKNGEVISEGVLSFWRRRHPNANEYSSPDTYKRAVANPTNPPTPTPTSTPTPPPAIIQNGGFEKGQAPWQESSSGGYQMVGNANVHSGQYSAYFCGYVDCTDRIWQTSTVPTNFTKITITYWWYSDTNKTTNKCYDYFSSSLKTSASANNSIRILQYDCNLVSKVTNAWVPKSYDVTGDLLKYKGQQVTLFFQGTNDNEHQPTDFFIDDVAVIVQ